MRHLSNLMFLLICSGTLYAQSFKLDSSIISDFQNLNLEAISRIENGAQPQPTPQTSLPVEFGIPQIGKSFYPNPKGYLLENPLLYSSIDSIYRLETQYFYTKKDSLVRVILFEWNWPSKLQKFDPPEDTTIKPLKNSELYQFKFEQLRKYLLSVLELPSEETINSKGNTNNYRDTVKWNKSGKLNAHLTVLANKDSYYGRVRLVIYKD